MPQTQVTFLGDGAMATVCGLILAEKGARVTFWSHDAENLKSIEKSRENTRYLPGIRLPANFRFEPDGSRALAEAELVVSAIPTPYLRSVWSRLGPAVPAGIPVVSVTKGIENDTLLRPSQIIAQLRNGDPALVMALSGPSIARELGLRQPASVCLAGTDAVLLRKLQDLWNTSWFRVYTNPDLVGVELAGATKNVIALAAGILDGLAAGYNAKSALLSRGLAETVRLGLAMGAEAGTFFGVTGVGDLATTCFCPEGRNRSAGELLGQGFTLQQTLDRFQGVVEGVATARSVRALALRHAVQMPITEAVHDVLFEGLGPREAIARLMSRPAGTEKIG